MSKHFKLYYYLLIFISVVFSAYISFIVLKYQYIGIYVSLNNNGEYEIYYVEKYSHGDKLGLDVGDIVLEVNGKEASEHNAN